MTINVVDKQPTKVIPINNNDDIVVGCNCKSFCCNWVDCKYGYEYYLPHGNTNTYKQGCIIGTICLCCFPVWLTPTLLWRMTCGSIEKKTYTPVQCDNDNTYPICCCCYKFNDC